MGDRERACVLRKVGVRGLGEEVEEGTRGARIKGRCAVIPSVVTASLVLSAVFGVIQSATQCGGQILEVVCCFISQSESAAAEEQQKKLKGEAGLGRR